MKSLRILPLLALVSLCPATEISPLSSDDSSSNTSSASATTDYHAANSQGQEQIANPSHANKFFGASLIGGFGILALLRPRRA